MTNKSRAVSFRLDIDLQPIVKKWLDNNPGITVSRLANLAIRGFVTQDQVFKGVETIQATKSETKKSLKKMMKKHKKTLDELK